MRISDWSSDVCSSDLGVAEITNQLEYDDEVAFQGEAELYRLARKQESQPWCLTVSFTLPHDPYVSRRQFWDLYEDFLSLLPEVVPIPYEKQVPLTKRLLEAVVFRRFQFTLAHVRSSLLAFFSI